jgi:hypothetical protein
MHLDGITANLPQLPLEIVIERKDNLLKSFDAVFEKTDSLTADINFLWDHHALCKHQVKALVPLPVEITEIERLDNCPNCLWCKLEGLLQIPEEVRTKIDSDRIPPTRKALFTRGPIRKRQISSHEERDNPVTRLL